MTDGSGPPISVVVSTHAAWPKVEPVLEALGPQLAEPAAELVIVDGTVDGSAIDERRAAALLPRPCRLRVLHAPGSDVFELRAFGVVEASGRIVAMIEDHCIPAPDYVVGVLRSHESHPEHAIAGAVTNGSTDRLMDRVSFLLVHARNVPPRDSLPDPGWIPTPSNISYKRAAVPASVPDRGWLETVHNVALLFANQVAFDDRVVVSHVQSSGRLGTFKNHFHAGRSMGGLGRDAIGSRAAQARWALRLTFSLPIQLLRPIWELQRRSRTPPRVALPLMAVAAAVTTADALGFACGVIAGPGHSPAVVD